MFWWLDLFRENDCIVDVLHVECAEYKFADTLSKGLWTHLHNSSKLFNRAALNWLTQNCSNRNNNNLFHINTLHHNLKPRAYRLSPSHLPCLIPAMGKWSWGKRFPRSSPESVSATPSTGFLPSKLLLTHGNQLWLPGDTQLHSSYGFLWLKTSTGTLQFKSFDNDRNHGKTAEP